MTSIPMLAQPPGRGRLWPVWFAQGSDQDLDFDDGLEDFDDSDPQPPSRRPLILILILLLVGGVGYFLLDPGAFSTLTSLVTAPGSKTPHPTPQTSSPAHDGTKAGIPHPPTPAFQEGQLVAVVSKTNGPSLVKLSGDAEGKQPGPTVKAGELLTILDGSLVNNSWVYLVHTKSGASGWIREQQLKAQS